MSAAGMREPADVDPIHWPRDWHYTHHGATGRSGDARERGKTTSQLRFVPYAIGAKPVQRQFRPLTPQAPPPGALPPPARPPTL